MSTAPSPEKVVEPPANGLLLDVAGLTVSYRDSSSVAEVVRDLSFSVSAGETLGIAGESGAGKSQSVLAVMGLVDPAADVEAERVLFDGQDLRSLSTRELRAVRGGEIGFVFQDALSSLNPVLKVGNQIVETIRVHQGLSKARAWKMCEQLLDDVGLDHPRQRARQYPHELSGGMRQRALIAMAIANEPKLLIADEPTTALDVTVQAEILDLIDRLKKERQMALILITHDLALLAQNADRVDVFYAGRCIERGSVNDIFLAPTHPYTIGLLGSIPRLDRRLEQWQPIAGYPPSPYGKPPGCAFAPRCRFVRERCRQAVPPLSGDPDHRAACVLSSSESSAARKDLLDLDTAARESGSEQDR